jgi:subtilisin family serine protease
LAALLVTVGSLTPASAAPESDVTGTFIYALDPAKALPDQYIVVLKDKATTSATAQVAARHGVAPRFTYTAALKGFALRGSEDLARRIAADPAVDYVVQDETVSINVFVQPNPPSWGLDRIDERSLPLDSKYHYPNTAGRIRAYILDTGIRFTHQEFGGRAVLGVDTIGDGQNGNDCHGHGTHVAGTVGGKSVGVAKEVQLIAVRVLNCFGSGSCAQVIAGIDWVTNDVLTGARGLAVANMSLGAAGVNAAVEAAFTRPPRIMTTECSCKLCPSPGI